MSKKGYLVEAGYMGFIGGAYMLFSCEEDYLEYLTAEAEA